MTKYTIKPTLMMVIASFLMIVYCSNVYDNIAFVQDFRIASPDDICMSTQSECVKHAKNLAHTGVPV